MKKCTILTILIIFLAIDIYSQTITFVHGSGVRYTLTPCTKDKALDTIDFFMESKTFYHYNLYPLDYSYVLNEMTITNGITADFERVYNGFSYGTITMGYLIVNCIMYSNSKIGQYSLLQFADTDLGGGVVHQNLKRIFERSINQVDSK